MTSKFQRKMDDLKACRCPECYGSGEVDDAEPGDISFNTWECPKCDGTGMVKPTKASEV